MAVTTTIARHYYWRIVIMIVVSIALGGWGAYDLWVSIPYKNWINDVYQKEQQLYTKLEEKTLNTEPGTVDAETLELLNGTPGVTLDESASEREGYEALTAIVGELLGTKEPPARPSAFDHYVQWMFISCILCVPYFAWRMQQVKGRNYTLDDDGNLALPGGTTWSRDEIASIDMSKWMAKSIAWVEHSDGRRVKLDAYLRANMEHVIGRIAHRFDPESWNEDGTQVKEKDVVPDKDSSEDVIEDAADPTDAADEVTY